MLNYVIIAVFLFLEPGLIKVSVSCSQATWTGISVVHCDVNIFFSYGNKVRPWALTWHLLSDRIKHRVTPSIHLYHYILFNLRSSFFLSIFFTWNWKSWKSLSASLSNRVPIKACSTKSNSEQEVWLQSPWNIFLIVRKIY